jgi:hypothetical protein
MATLGRMTAPLVAALLVAALLVAALAAPAAARTPQGQGLTTLASEGITALTCPADSSITVETVIIPRGGTPVWIADGRMYLLQSLDIAGTFNGFPVSFSKTWGKKTGLSDEVITCSFDSAGEGFEGSGTVTLVRVW